MTAIQTPQAPPLETIAFGERLDALPIDALWRGHA